MHAVNIRFVIVAFLVTCSVAVASGASSHVFELPDHGTLALLVPNGWTDQLNQPPNRLPPTIKLKPRAGKQFEVLLTTVWPNSLANELPDETAIRSEVAGAAKSAAPQSIEGVLPLQDIKGVAGRGYYFAATDRAPNPGEYKYLTQGIIRVGKISLAFTVLTNDGQEPVVQSALEMLRTAVHRPSSTI
jgi:hypothetical protein